VFEPAGARRIRPVVVFLHGWAATDPLIYGPWLRHLVDQGDAVVYPAYQVGPFDPPNHALAGALAGIQNGLRVLGKRAGPLVVAGHSAGGALSADYAAVAARVGLPKPRAIMLAYGGRKLPRIPFSIPAVDPARIPASVRILALAGAQDHEVGDVTARATVAGAVHVPRARRRLVIVRDPAVDGHIGPQKTAPAAQRAFWFPLDRLVAEA
jgi:acetyl esterase/lipase